MQRRQCLGQVVRVDADRVEKVVRTTVKAANPRLLEDVALRRPLAPPRELTEIAAAART